MKQILLSLGLSLVDGRWPQDWRQLTCRQREGDVKASSIQFGLMNRNNSGSRAHGTGLNQQSSSIFVFEVECFGKRSLIPSLFYFRYLKSTLSITWDSSCHNTKQLALNRLDCFPWPLFPAFMLNFARIFHLKCLPVLCSVAKILYLLQEPAQFNHFISSKKPPNPSTPLMASLSQIPHN